VLPDLVNKGYSAREIRFFLVQSHYRQPAHLTRERLEAARASLRRLDECVANLRSVSAAGSRVPELEASVVAMKEGVREALFDDLNISATLAGLFHLVRKVNYLMAQGRLFSDDAADVLRALRTVDEVLGVLPADGAPEVIPADVQALMRKRDAARAQRDFRVADEIRDDLTTRGYIVEDVPTGTRVKRRG
jgi:cysteinyl-tRNA synthetase